MTAEMERRAGPATLTWHPDERLGVLRFTERGTGTGAHAQELVAAMVEWAGPGARYRFLVDCSQIGDVDAGWRTAWAEFFKTQTEEATVAWFNASQWIKVIILMFRKGTGVHGRVFSTEDEARTWLDTQTPAPA